MMQSVGSTSEEGERAYKRAKLNHSSNSSAGPVEVVQTEVKNLKSAFCIHTRLRALHETESAKHCNYSNLRGIKRTSHLLDKLVAQEKLNTVILNLYPGNKGYSLAFENQTIDMAPSCSSGMLGDNPDVTETRLWPYEEEELLRCIDHEELPPFFSDIFESNFSYLFYSGCVIVQVRDYRQSYPHTKCDIHHVLLKPSLRSILADLNVLMEDKKWSLEETQLLESEILAANNPNLCLDPSPRIGEIQTKFSHTNHLLNTHRLGRTARKYSQISVNRKRKLDQFSHRPGLELFNYITRVKNKPKTPVTVSSLGSNKFTKKLYNEIRSVPAPTLELPIISSPSKSITINEFKQLEYPLKERDCLPRLLEEYVLETEMPSKVKGASRIYHIKLSIQQRPSDFEYLGELYLDRDYKKGEKNGVACQFALGSRAAAARYVQQFAEIFTEGGRKPVTVKYSRNPIFSNQIPEMEAQQTPLTSLSKHPTQQKSVQLSTMNGMMGPGVMTFSQDNSILPNCSTVVMQSQPKNNRTKLSTSEIEIKALAIQLMNSGPQSQAASNTKQQKIPSVSNNAAIINILNSSPASNLNSDTSATVIHAINNTSIPQQIQTINNKLVGRKLSISSNPRVINSNIITVNNNTRINLTDLKGQTIALKSTNANFAQTTFSSVPIKHIVNQRVNENTTSLSALLVGTPAADRPDIVGTNTNSLLLEKLGGASVLPNSTQNPRTHYTVQSPKSVLSPLSSPPQQNVSTLQNMQVQLPGFSHPISVSLNLQQATQGPHGSIIVSLPSAASASSVSQQTVNNLGGAKPTVVLTNSGRAQIVTSTIKGLTQKNLMAATSTGITLTQGSQQFQLVTPLQRPRVQQNNLPQNIVTHGIQRTPVAIKMASPSTTTPQVVLPLNTSLNSVTQQQLQIQQLQFALQKQVSVQPYQQICVNQPQNRVIRRSSSTDTKQ